MQATLHNAHFVRAKGEPPFSADMFMPGYKAPVKSEESWKMEALKMQAFVPQTSEQKAAAIADIRYLRSCYQERAVRMDQARARGASGKELQAIMEG